MRLRHLLSTLCVAIISTLALPIALAQASPVTVNVRIEGADQTLFEGPLAVEPHGVRATSEGSGKLRPCNGINSLDPWNTVPAPTPTAAAADAMALVGETFDGKWYPGFNDYFITRFGPDREVEGRSWGILVNNTFTNVGGCQYQLDEGDEVLWIFNAFNSRPNLALFPAGDPSGSRPLTATAVLGQPFEVEAVAYGDDLEDNPPPHPERSGSSPYAGASVSPVHTDAKGFEQVEASNPETEITDSEGKARITFTTPGWHRIKATVPGAGEEAVFRSNRLDVCVPALGQTDCGEPPPEDRVRVPPPTAGETEEPGEGSRGAGGATGGGQASGGGPQPAPGPAARPDPLRVSAPKLNRKRLRQGRLVVTWKVIDPGAGVTRWRIDSRTLRSKKPGWVRRAGGTKGTSTSLRLPRGHAYRLRFTITDADGRSSKVMIGKVVIPGGRRG